MVLRYSSVLLTAISGPRPAIPRRIVAAPLMFPRRWRATVRGCRSFRIVAQHLQFVGVPRPEGGDHLDPPVAVEVLGQQGDNVRVATIEVRRRRSHRPQSSAPGTSSKDMAGVGPGPDQEFAHAVAVDVGVERREQSVLAPAKQLDRGAVLARYATPRDARTRRRRSGSRWRATARARRDRGTAPGTSRGRGRGSRSGAAGAPPAAAARSDGRVRRSRRASSGRPSPSTSASTARPRW